MFPVLKASAVPERKQPFQILNFLAIGRLDVIIKL